MEDILHMDVQCIVRWISQMYLPHPTPMIFFGGLAEINRNNSYDFEPLNVEFHDFKLSELWIHQFHSPLETSQLAVLQFGPRHQKSSRTNPDGR